MLRATALAAVLSAVLAAPAAAYPTGPALRAIVQRTDPCLAAIIERETGGTWSPTIYNGFTYWHPGDPPSSRSYGLPQAQPPEKMARYGKDWRTNPWTQLRFMRAYTKARYGSACAAWAYWQRHRGY